MVTITLALMVNIIPIYEYDFKIISEILSG